MIRWFVLWYYALDVRLSFDSFTGLQVDPRIVEVGSYYWLMKKEFHVRLHDPAILIYYFSGKRKNNKRQKKKKSKNMMHIFQWSCDGMLTGLRRLHRLQKNMPTLHYSLNIQAHAHAKVGIWGPNREILADGIVLGPRFWLHLAFAITVLLWDRGTWNGSIRCRGKCDGYPVNITSSQVKTIENVKEIKELIKK